MQPALIYEFVGYAASILVAISLMMRSIWRLRAFSLLGAISFTVYGALIHAYPIAVLNALIVLINLYYLWQMRQRQEYFSLLELHPDSPYLLRFLEFYGEDIARFAPGFSYAPDPQALVCFVLRDLSPASVLIAQRNEGGELAVQFDYVIPGYRDFKVNRFLYEDQAQVWLERGIERVSIQPIDEKHRKALAKIGFVSGQDGRCTRKLVPTRIGL